MCQRVVALALQPHHPAVVDVSQDGAGIGTVTRAGRVNNRHRPTLHKRFRRMATAELAVKAARLARATSTFARSCHSGGYAEQYTQIFKPRLVFLP